jgi:hypothetical protein
VPKRPHLLRDEEAQSEEAKMKYFTPEVILRTRSEDDDTADAASEEWDRLQECYLGRLKEIDPKMPRSLRSLLKRYYLHDARVSTIALDDGTTLTMVLQLDGHDNGGLQLTYSLTAPLKIHLHPEIVEGEAPLEWLYDEVDLIDTEPPTFQHNILLTDGSELEVRFRGLTVKRFRKLLFPGSQPWRLDATLETELLAS